MEWVRNAKVGDKIVSIAEGYWRHPEYVKYSREVGKVYTITAVEIDAQDGDVVFKISGMPKLCTYSPGLFKPVSRRGTETGMNILRALLVTEGVRA